MLPVAHFVVLASLFVTMTSSADLHTNMEYARRLQNRILGRDDPVDLPTPEMIERAGYPAEIHHVTTEDGYILEMHRIPYGRDSPQEPGKPVIFLQHGLLCSSADWILNIPEKALAFMLADRGYDVWMGNARGNTYSRNHTTLSPDNDDDFWLFSWDHMGKYDVPAELNYVTTLTGQEKVYYVGHSMGTTMFWVMMNHHPEINDKIRVMFALGPVAYVGNMISPIRYLAPFVNQIEWLAQFIGLYEFMPSNEIMQWLADNFCDEDSFVQGVCTNIVFLLCGYNPNQMNETALPVIMGHTPAGTSTSTIVHFAQEVNSDRFQHFDYGEEGNLGEYGQPTPPDYDLGKITTPVALIWSENDWLADPEDAHLLGSQLDSMFLMYGVPDPKWNHLDFLWGIDADTMVYEKIFEFLPYF